jgi:hypothetical protein
VGVPVQHLRSQQGVAGPGLPNQLPALPHVDVVAVEVESPLFGTSSASSPSRASRASAPAVVLATVVTVLALTVCTSSGKIAGNPAENTGWSGGSRRWADVEDLRLAG